MKDGKTAKDTDDTITVDSEGTEDATDETEDTSPPEDSTEDETQEGEDEPAWLRRIEDRLTQQDTKIERVLNQQQEIMKAKERQTGRKPSGDTGKSESTPTVATVKPPKAKTPATPPDSTSPATPPAPAKTKAPRKTRTRKTTGLFSKLKTRKEA